MRLDLLEEYLVLVKHMNYTKAAQEIHITQSALSKHIMELEKELGFSLIRRHARGRSGFELTSAGRVFFEELSYIFSLYYNVLEKCAKMADSPTLILPELLQNEAMVALYRIASEFLSDNPETEVSYARYTETDPSSALQKGAYDASFSVEYTDETPCIRDDGSMVSYPLAHTTLLAWASNSNKPLLEKNSLSVLELAEYPLVMSAFGTQDYITAAFSSSCKERGISLHFRKAVGPSDNASDGFARNFVNGLFLTTKALADDPRLSMQIITHPLVIEDGAYHIVFYLSVLKGGKAQAIEPYILRHSEQLIEEYRQRFGD